MASLENRGYEYSFENSPVDFAELERSLVSLLYSNISIDPQQIQFTQDALIFVDFVGKKVFLTCVHTSTDEKRPALIEVGDFYQLLDHIPPLQQDAFAKYVSDRARRLALLYISDIKYQEKFLKAFCLKTNIKIRFSATAPKHTCFEDAFEAILEVVLPKDISHAFFEDYALSFNFSKDSAFVKDRRNNKIIFQASISEILELVPIGIREDFLNHMWRSSLLEIETIFSASVQECLRKNDPDHQDEELNTALQMHTADLAALGILGRTVN